jgi:hypothetical protein
MVEINLSRAAWLNNGHGLNITQYVEHALTIVTYIGQYAVPSMASAL